MRCRAAEGGDAVVEVVDDERHDREVERVGFEPVERQLEVVDAKRRLLLHAVARQLDHRRAAVDADDLPCAAPDELLREEAGTAAGVEHAETPDVATEVQRRRAVVERVVGAGLRVSCIVVGEGLEGRVIDRHREIMTDFPDARRRVKRRDYGTAASSSAVSVQSAAPALARTCSGVVAPQITDPTPSCAASHAIASSSSE